ncbi:hypothetical protein D6833_13130 [Candidatus Parcubacteria bacterium]|nr:MAG: hypothetical protein D6833_13130 [Candidatus Parcubacteria bacterium]
MNVKHPLAEVFGFPPDNLSPRAQRYRRNRLCPFNNKVPNCTKDKANAPLGVCSIYMGEHIAITCPVRFRQDWLIAEQAAQFFFPSGAQWTSLTEVRINDASGKSAGNIDVVLVSYDEAGKVIDFGALEVQAVYISGNIRRPFEYYMEDPQQRFAMDWRGRPYYPRADYLSSSRKRLAPQLIYKGNILNAWGKKTAVVVDRGFFETLPTLPVVSKDEANLAWFVYDLVPDPDRNVFDLQLQRSVYTRFKPALEVITTPVPGQMTDFIDFLQGKLDEKLGGLNPPDAPTLTDAFGEEAI